MANPKFVFLARSLNQFWKDGSEGWDKCISWMSLTDMGYENRIELEPIILFNPFFFFLSGKSRNMSN
jgi:hypothetical protein